MEGIYVAEASVAAAKGSLVGSCVLSEVSPKFRAW